MKYAVCKPYGVIFFYEDSALYRIKENRDNDLTIESYFKPGDLRKHHRTTGPAVIYSRKVKMLYKGKYYIGDKFYFYDGKKLDCNNDEQFNRLMKLKAFF